MMMVPTKKDGRQAGRQGGQPERRKVPLKSCISCALERYFKDLDGNKTNGLYDMVLNEIEPPLLKMVMQYTEDNQTKAAELLGINRSTLRKKLEKHGLLR